MLYKLSGCCEPTAQKLRHRRQNRSYRWRYSKPLTRDRKRYRVYPEIVDQDTEVWLDIQGKSP